MSKIPAHALLAAESRLRSLVENLPLVVYTVGLDDEAAEPRYVSPQVLDLIGVSPETFTFQDLRDNVHPDDREAAVAAFTAANRDRQSLTVEYRLIRPDGAVVYIEDSSTVTRVGDEHIAQGYLLDITKRREAEQRLRDAEVHYRSLVENLPLVIYTRTLEPDSSTSRALFMSGQVEAMLEITAAEAQPGRVREMIHPDDFDRIAPLYDEANRLQQPLSVEYRVITPSGRTVWVHDESRVVRDDAGNGLHAQGYLLDITATRAAQAETAAALEGERAARIEAEQARAAIILTVENIGDAFVSFGRDLRFRYANAEAAAMLGRPAADLVGRTPWEIFPETLSSAFVDALQRSLAGESVELSDYSSAVLDGVFELRFHPSPDGVWLFARNVTERRSLEDSLRQAQKMEAVGQLAGGIAHDFNNLLTAIVGYADFALRDLDEPEPDVRRIRSEVEGIKQAGARAAELTRDLLAFSRRQVLDRRVVDPNELLAGAERLLRRVIGENVELVVVPKAGLPAVEADAAQFEQVILNLALNARDAMPKGGRLTIGTELTTLSVADAKSLEVGPGDYVTLLVEDTGTGMADDVRARIFEPFFTTKAVGEGTGLGLATAYGIVRQSGGTIAVESELGVGSTFRVHLPPTATPAAAPETETVPVTENEGTERILLVEDEPTLRDLVAQMLRQKGYDVVAADPSVAVELAREERFALLVTDVVMPGTSGAELAESVRAFQPTIGVLFVSGYTRTILDGTELGPTVRFLAKPFTADDLATSARGILDAVRAPA